MLGDGCVFVLYVGIPKFACLSFQIMRLKPEKIVLKNTCLKTMLEVQCFQRNALVVDGMA